MDIESHRALISRGGQLPQPTHLRNGTGHTVTQCHKRTRTQIQPLWAEPFIWTKVDATEKKQSKVTQTPVTATELFDPKRHEIQTLSDGRADLKIIAVVVTHQKTRQSPFPIPKLLTESPTQRRQITNNFVHEREGPEGLLGLTAEALQTACFITNRFAALGNLSDSEDINRVWKNIKESINTSAKES